MRDLVDNLVKLQGLELERARLAQIARGLPAEIAKAEDDLRKAQEESAKLSDALMREESLRTKLERDLRLLRAEAARKRARAVRLLACPAVRVVLDRDTGVQRTHR